MSHPYPPHRPDFSYVGKVTYSLTFRAASGTTPFARAEDVSLVLQQFLRAARQYKFELTAYCFMPDHVHLLVVGLEADSDCRRFIRAAKQYSGYSYSRTKKRTLWQRYGYERIVRDEVERWTTIRYIIDNPVKAGLVNECEEYPFVGSGRYSLAELIAQAAPRDENTLPLAWCE